MNSHHVSFFEPEDTDTHIKSVNCFFLMSSIAVESTSIRYRLIFH